jgi:tetratricopeptide (TPR) repeat protein
MHILPGLLLSLSMVLSGCIESTRPSHRAFSETPSYSADSSMADGGGITQKTPKEMISAGFAYLAAGNATLARLHFVSALKREPKSSWAYVGLGDISYQIGDYPSALANYQKAASFDEDNLAAILGQAQSLRQQGKLKEAMAKVDQAKALGPNDVRVLTEQAINYDLQGQESLAAPIYREVASRTPDQAAAFNNLGVNEMSQAHYAEAITNFSKAYMLDSKDPRIANNLAMAFALYGQQDQAHKLFSKTVGDAAAWNNLGYLYLTQGKFDEAEAALRKALELDPKFYARAQENLDRLDQLRLAKQQVTSPTAPVLSPEAEIQPQPAPTPAPAPPGP